MSDPVRLDPLASRPPRRDEDVLIITLGAGQTLLDVQRKTGLSLEQIFRANPQLTSDRQLQAGQQLRLPLAAEPLEDRAAAGRTWARPGTHLDDRRPTLAPQHAAPLLKNPYQDTVETAGLISHSLGAAVGVGLAGRDATPAQQRRAAELGQSAEALVGAALTGRAVLRRAARAAEIEASWEGKPVRGYRGDADFGKHVVTRPGSESSAPTRTLKAFITDRGNLRPADPEGSATALQQIMGREPAKSRSPFTSIKIDRSSGKYFGGKAIEIDLAALRRDVAGGRVPGVQIIEHRELMKLHHQNIEAARRTLQLEPSRRNREALRVAQEIAGYSLRDQEALIRGTLPGRYFRPATPGRDVEPRATGYERRLGAAPAQVERLERQRKE